jgi:hypothetical protein
MWSVLFPLLYRKHEYMDANNVLHFNDSVWRWQPKYDWFSVLWAHRADYIVQDNNQNMQVRLVTVQWRATFLNVFSQTLQYLFLLRNSWPIRERSKTNIQGRFIPSCYPQLRSKVNVHNRDVHPIKYKSKLLNWPKISSNSWNILHRSKQRLFNFFTVLLFCSAFLVY